MLELQLTLQDNQVNVKANGKESHEFSLIDLSQSKEEWKNFLDNPRLYGAKLFQALLKDGSAAWLEFDQLSKQTEREIVLVLESSELDAVAWEYAYNKFKEEYVVEDCAFVRALPEKERPAKWHLKSDVDRVPLLFIPANPLLDLSGEPMHELNIESEWREVKQFIEKSNAPFDLMELRPATPAALQSVMARFQNGMIAHFSGHGAATKDGAFLLFENENGSSNPLEARDFVREVKDQAWIGFLSACQSAVAERTAFGNLARELVKAGVPFALGMQFNLPDPFAPNISGQFYNYLSQGHTVPEAARQARRAVKRENEFYVGMIALYAAHPDKARKMGWTGSGARTLPTFTEADVSDLPTPSRFIGRQRELMNIGTSLLGKKKPNTVTLHGAGGIGKTALMRQALLRFAPSFESALAIPLNPLPSSLESILGRLERFLNLPSPCSKDTKERERIVRERLTSKRTLLGLDNFETLNYALNERGSDKEKTAKSLHTFFKSLAANGVSLCVTSREVTNLPGETVEDIQGLTDENGGRLFQENVVRQKDEIYIEKTKQVSEMVGGHPLALRLLASAFDDQVGTSLDQYIDSLQSFLPKARDKWTEEDRHESLRASFDFTMNNLSKTEEGKSLQTALAKLSVFISFFFDATAAPVLENGFPEKNEQYSEDKRNADNTLHTLWERGLLELAAIPMEDGNYYMYRLHPVLIPFAKELLAESQIDSIKNNFLKSMSNLARIAEGQITKVPQIADMTYRSLPDLLFASESKSDISDALMNFRIGVILRHFGLHDDAIKAFQKSLDIDMILDEKKGEAVALQEIGYIREIRGDLDGALELYQRSLELKEEADDLKGKATTLTRMASIYEIRGDLDKAKKLYEQSIEIDEKLGDPNGKAVTQGNMGIIHSRHGDFDKALDMYKQSFIASQKSGDQREMSVALHNIAEVYADRGDFDGAMKLSQESLAISEDLHDLKSKSGSLYQMAGICARRGDLDGALKLYKQTFEIKEELGDLRGKANVLQGMGNIYLTRRDLDEAMKSYQHALSIMEGLDDVHGKVATMNGIATIYFARDDLDEAIKLYQQVLVIVENLNDPVGKTTVLGMLGQALWKLGHHSEGLQALLNSLEISLKFSLRTEVEKSKGIIKVMRNDIGENKFDSLWEEITGQKIPEWLYQSWKQEQDVTNLFIMVAIKAAREKDPQVKEFYEFTQKMAADSGSTAEMRELGRVLSRILVGDTKVDLSRLPEELVELVRKELRE